MKPTKFTSVIALVALATLGSPPAHAQGLPRGRPFPKIFAASEAPSTRVLAAIRNIDRNCTHSMMSRSGPSPDEQRRCERAETMLVSLKPSALGPVFAKLDDDNLGIGARVRLYDAVGRFADMNAVGVLVNALKRLSAPDAEVREWEATHIELALQQLTFAKVGRVLPWETGDPRAPDLASREWNEWLSHHPTLDPESLLAERLSADREHLRDPDFWRAFWYASFFCEHAAGREEGMQALRDLLSRNDLDSDQKSTIRERLAAAKRAAHEERAAKPRPKVRPAQSAAAGAPNV